jgi:PIN domain nuclease of toxin-antitoxin system
MLLDTNVVIYLMTGSRTLPDAVMKRLRDPEENRAVSLATFWEMTIKHGKGKLPLPAPFTAEPVETFEHWCARAVIDILPIAPRHMARAMRLDFPNTDPFDRLIAATALCEDQELVTSDVGFGRCAGLRVIGA